MLIRKEILERNQSGDVTLQFRRWRRPTVKTGGTLTTRVGVLDIKSVEQVEPTRITSADAKRAGFADKAELLAALSAREGDTYRIQVAYAGVDPRIALRENDKLSKTEFEEIAARLAKMDASASIEPWTLHVLQAIQREPLRRAVELAADMGLEKREFKPRVRKLKTLGLTISERTGYSLSPRGEAVLKYLER